MHLSSIILPLSALAATAVAIKLPSDLPDGVYAVDTDPATGKDTFIAVDISGVENIPPPPFAPSNITDSDADAYAAPSLAKRVAWPKNTQAICNPNFFWEVDFYSFTWNGFYASCKATNGAHLKDKRAVFVKYQTSVSYMCNYSSKGNPCNVDEWNEAVGWAAGSCNVVESGWRQGAYLNIPNWKKSYGFENSDREFC